MAATMAGALKATIEGAGLGLAAYRDGAPTRVEENGTRTVLVPYPHVVIQEGIAVDPEAHGDTDDPDGHRGVRELVQMELLQLARAADGSVLESYALPGDLVDYLATCTRALQPHAPWRVYGVRVQSTIRVGPTNNLIRHIITLVIRRDARRRP